MKAFKSFFKDVDDSLNYDLEELTKGITVELEHTPYKSIARIIAKHHLAEDPQYYSKMKGDIPQEDTHEDEEQRLDPSCWEGYKKQGTKVKDGVRVNNCVKK